MLQEYEQVVILRGSQLFQQNTYLTSESNTTVNFCTPFKTSVNDMKYRERSNGLATHRDRFWFRLHVTSHRFRIAGVSYLPTCKLFSVQCPCIVLCGIVWRYCALRDLSTAHKPLHCAFWFLGMNNLSKI